jgi:hypothetical protein
VRVKGDPKAYTKAIEAAVWTVDRDQPIADVMPSRRQSSTYWLRGPRLAARTPTGSFSVRDFVPVKTLPTRQRLASG